MALSTTRTSETFYDIVAATAVDCNWPLYAEDEVKVFYGQDSLEAELNVDFTVTLNPDDYDTFDITPTATLIAKIDALIAADPDNEINYITVRRVLENTTTVQKETVRLTPFLSREIERTNMKLQQLNEEVQRSLVLPPKVAGSETSRYYVSVPEDGKALVWDADISEFVPGPDADEIVAAQGYATSAAASAVEAAESAALAQTAYDNFDDRYLGAKAADPTLDNDGDPLADGALYFNTTTNLMRIYDLGGTAWNDVTTALIDGSVTAEKLAAEAVTGDKIERSIGYFSAGDFKFTIKTVADTGWIMADDGTIGSAGSGASNRANADTEDLYTALWNSISDTYAPVTGGRGASAAADFAADKPISLTRMLGRAVAVAGSGSGLTARALGEYLGEEEHTLTVDEMPAHTHSYDTHTTADADTSGTGPKADNAASLITGSTGGDDPHNNMQPTSFYNVMFKL